MRTPLLLLVLAVVVTAAVMWSLTGDEDPAPVTGGGTEPRAVAPREPAAVERTDASPVTRPTPPPVEPTPPPAANGSVPAPADAPVTVVLNVRDITAREHVAAFRWRFRNSLVTARGDGKDGRAELPLPASMLGELLVEADGYAPLTQPQLVVPTPPAAALKLDLFMVPAVKAAGITLHVRDLSSQSVAHVRVDAFKLTAENRDKPWHLGAPMWARRTQNAQGRYVLPELAAGDYGIRVVGTKEDGTLLPLLPWRGTFALTGDNGFVEDVPLEPGALLAVELVDAAGQAWDPSRHGVTGLLLTVPGAPPQQRKWITRSGTSEAGAIDTLPGVGRAELAEAVPAGHYTLQVIVGGTQRAQQTMMLRGGDEHAERVQLP